MMITTLPWNSKGDVLVDCLDCGQHTAMWHPVEFNVIAVDDPDVGQIWIEDFGDPVAWELRCQNCEAIAAAEKKEYEHMQALLQARYGTVKPASIADWWTG